MIGRYTNKVDFYLIKELKNAGKAVKLNRKPSLTLLADCIPSPCSRTLQTHTLNTGSAEQAVSLNHGARCAHNCGRKP